MKKLLFATLVLFAVNAHGQIDGNDLIDNSTPQSKLVDGAIVLSGTKISGALNPSKISSQANNTVLGNISGAAAAPTAIPATDSAVINSIVKRNASGASTFSSVLLKSSTGSAAYDASILSENGGSSVNQGLLKLIAGQGLFMGWDGSTQFGFGSVSNTTEFWRAEGGVTGNGATLFATNASGSGAVHGSLALQENGRFTFGNGLGQLLVINAQSNATTFNPFTISPGTATSGPVLASPASARIQAPSNNVIDLFFYSGGAGGERSFRFSGGLATSKIAVISNNTDDGMEFSTKGAGTYAFSDGAGSNYLALLRPASGASTGGIGIRLGSGSDPIRLYSSSNSVLVGGTASNGFIGATATTGFLQIPYGSGPPTGSPTQLTGGGIPIYFDSSRSQIHAYNSTLWTIPGAERGREIAAAGAVTVSDNDNHVCVNKATGAATTVNLPSSPTPWRTITVEDCKGDAATNKITVTPNGATLIDGASTYIVNTNWGAWSGVWTGSYWKTTSALRRAYSGVSSSIGGSPVAAGACASNTVSIAGAATGMAVQVTPTTYPGDGFYWLGYVSAAGTVIVKVCAVAMTMTPTTSTYNVMVTQP